MQFVRVAWMAAALVAFGCEDPEPESVVRTPMIEEPGDERATPDGNSGSPGGNEILSAVNTLLELHCINESRQGYLDALVPLLLRWSRCR